MSDSPRRQRPDQGGQDLELTIRSANVVKHVGAITVGDLVRFTEEEILETRCFGETSLNEIKARLAERGLRLGMSPAELHGRPGLQARVVAQPKAGTKQLAAEPEAEPDHNGACCGHCEAAARELRARAERERKLAIHSGGTDGRVSG
jgi:hypothetical protein